MFSTQDSSLRAPAECSSMVECLVWDQGAGGSIPLIPITKKETMKLVRKILRPYQRDIVRYGRSVQHPRIFADMRLGKTVCTIRIISSYAKEDRGLVLVVAPFSAWDGWYWELKCEGKEITFIDGLKKKRLDILRNAKSGWFIVNYEAWRALGNELRDTDWDCVVLDESDMIKNPKAKVSKFFTQNFRFVKHRFILTGTPDPEDDLDFYQQIKFSDNTIFPERNYYQFRHNWCRPTGFGYGLKPSLRQRFQDVLGKHCFFIKRSDVNLGGEQIVQKRFVRLDAKHQAMYETLENEFILEDKETEVFKSTTEQFATYSWMRALASGCVDGKLSWGGKIEELLYLLQGQLKREQVVVWACFDAELYAIEKALKKEKISCAVLNGKISHDARTTLKHDFQEGKFKVLIAQPEIFKYGTDLSAASTIIYYSLPASAKTYRQSKDRTINLEKTGSCLIIYLLTEDTIDEDLCSNLEDKLDRSSMNHAIARSIALRVQNRRRRHAA